ncbi:MAG: MgtC/SapB family protein [Gemmatimonadota bacterium]|nr:MgtC/SapB family protein [Gemmatimonadota bacterium]
MSENAILYDTELLLRVVAAGLMSGLLGWERQSAGKPAGFRTLLLVGMAACLFVVAGEAAAVTYPAGSSSLRIEPFQLIQAVAVGIGFLGSGVVFLTKDGTHVIGLTTAASIWATAAVGLTVGFGRYFLAAGTTVLMLVTLRVLRRFDSSHAND